MANPAAPGHSEEQYLAMERESAVKHEFLDGQIYAMSGASRQHVRIELNIAGELRQRLRGSPCEPYGSNMRVKVQPSGLYTYPDVTVSCGEAIFEDDHLDTLVNPACVFEILSPSTERYNRGAKFRLYRELDSILDIVLVSSAEPLVEHYRRGENAHWDFRPYRELEDVLALENLNCTLPLAEIYEGVTFEPQGLRD